MMKILLSTILISLTLFQSSISFSQQKKKIFRLDDTLFFSDKYALSRGTFINEDLYVEIRNRNDNRLIIRTIVPEYLRVTGGLSKFFISNSEYLIWWGCYPHRCQDEEGYLIYDINNNRFYRIHHVGRDEVAFLNGKKLKRDDYINYPIGIPPYEILDTLLHREKLQNCKRVEGRLCSEYYCDGGSKAPDVRIKIDTIAYRMAVDKKLMKYGLHYMMNYPVAKEILLANGWNPSYDVDEFRPLKKYPEIVCGNVTCAVSFIKKNKILLLSVDDISVDNLPIYDCDVNHK